jgi:hypothetical protein
MSQFTVRYSLPAGGNKLYNNGNAGGWSWCINGKPTRAGLNVLSNCVGWACSRFNEIYNEITGYDNMKYKTLCCNAENFIERAKQAGLEVGTKPKAGAIMCWQKGDTLSTSDGAGHVAICEIVYDDNHVFTSESGYGGSAFWNSHRYNTNGCWGAGKGYKFRGFIYNPAVTDEPTPTPEPTPSDKFNIGDKVVINGALYKSSNATTAVGNVSNKVTNITRKVSGAKHPYNTTGDLGWMDETSIAKYEEPKPEPKPTPTPSQKFAIGDKVVISGALYVNANAENAVGSVHDRVTYITRYVRGAKHPYNTTNDLGWMDEASITAYAGAITYTVKKGDTLSSIAAKYGTTWQKIYARNKFVIGNNPNIIVPGQVLIIKD